MGQRASQTFWPCIPSLLPASRAMAHLEELTTTTPPPGRPIFSSQDSGSSLRGGARATPVWPAWACPTAVGLAQAHGAENMQDLGTLWTSQAEVSVAATGAGVGDGLSEVVKLWASARRCKDIVRSQPLALSNRSGGASASYLSDGARGVPAVVQSPIGSPSGVGVALRPPPKPFPKLRVGLAWGVVQPPSKAVQPVWEGAFDDVYRVYLVVASAGLFWIDAESLHDQNSRRGLLRTKLAQFQSDALRSKVTALRQWRTWWSCSPWSTSSSWWSPSVAAFGAGLQAAAERRPTTACSSSSTWSQAFPP